jgi:Transposase domain (DUF772)
LRSERSTARHTARWFNVPDPAVEEALYDSPTTQAFVGHRSRCEPVPDDTTVCKFRHLLEALLLWMRRSFVKRVGRLVKRGEPRPRPAPRSRGRSRGAVTLGALEFLDDLAALGEEAPRFLRAGEQERAEPELVTQPPRADQVPIRDQTPERE